MEGEHGKGRDGTPDTEPSKAKNTSLPQSSLPVNSQRAQPRQISTGAIALNNRLNRLDGQYDFLEDTRAANFREFSLSNLHDPTRCSRFQYDIGPPPPRPPPEPPSQCILSAAPSSVNSGLSKDYRDLAQDRSDSPGIPDYYLRSGRRSSRSSSGGAAAIDYITTQERESSLGPERRSLERVVRNPTPPLSHIGLQRRKTSATEPSRIFAHGPNHHYNPSIASLERDIRTLQAEVSLLKIEKASQNNKKSNSPKSNLSGPGPSNLRYSLSAESRDVLNGNPPSPQVRSRAKLTKINRSQSVGPMQGRPSNRNHQLLRTLSSRSSSSGSSRDLRKPTGDTPSEVREEDATTVATSQWSPESSPTKRSLIWRAGHKMKKRLRQKMFAVKMAKKEAIGQKKEQVHSVDGSGGECKSKDSPDGRSQVRSSRRRLERPSMRWLRRRPSPPYRPLSA